MQPPGLPVTEAVLSKENALLAEKNRLLAEENARLLNSQLAQQHAELARQNAALKQQAEILRKKSKPPPPGTWMPPGAWSGSTSCQLPYQGERRRSASNQSSDTCASNSGGSSSTPGSSFISDPSGASSAAKSETGQPQPAEATQTTVMMRNIPNDYTRDMLVQLLDKHGFAKQYDLVYLPIDFSSQAGFGYSFVNLVSADVAERFRVHFQGFRGWELPSDKVCDVLWSAARQGLQANVERFKNSPVMHESVPDKFKPALFVDGVRVPFPPPTRKPRAPEISGKTL